MNLPIDFFFNLIPGYILILVFEQLFDKKLSIELGVKLDTLESLAVYIIFSILIGFILQSITKVFREFPDRDKFGKEISYWRIYNINEIVWRKLKKEKPRQFVDAKSYIEFFIKNPEELSNRNIFYMMHNYLWGRRPSEGAAFFTTRLAFWSNVYFASVITFCLIYAKFLFLIFNVSQYHSPQQLFIFLVVALFIMVYSCCFFFSYLRAVYDVVLTTFLSTYKENNNTKNKR